MAAAVEPARADDLQGGSRVIYSSTSPTSISAAVISREGTGDSTGARGTPPPRL